MKVAKMLVAMGVVLMTVQVSAEGVFRGATVNISGLDIDPNSNGVTSVPPPKYRSCMDVADQPDGYFDIYLNGTESAPENVYCATPSAEAGGGWMLLGQYHAVKGTGLNNLQGDREFSRVYVAFAEGSNWMSAWPDHRYNHQTNGIYVGDQMHNLYLGNTLLHDYGKVGSHEIKVYHFGYWHRDVHNWTNDTGSFDVRIYIQ